MQVDEPMPLAGVSQPTAGRGPLSERLNVHTLWHWLALRYGPLAPHGVRLIMSYAIFVGLAHLISFGRMERNWLLTVTIVFVAALFLGMIGLFVWTLWRALRATYGFALPNGRRQILLFTFGASAWLLLLPRLFSKDVLSYLVYGRAFGAYGLNPYTTNPLNVQFDYNFRLIDWHYAESVYGPVWTLLCTALYRSVDLVNVMLGTSSIWSYIIGFRVLALIMHLGCVALVWDILGRLRPREQVAGTIFYAWNPLTMIEFAGNGHNDVALIFFLLAAIAAHARQRPGLTALFLALSVLSKFITLLIVPAYLMLLWRQEPTIRRRLLAWAKAGAVGLGAFLLLWAPFFEALRDPFFLVRSSAASQYQNSLLEVVYLGLRRLLMLALSPEQSGELAGQLVMNAGRIAFVVILLVLTWRVRDTAGWLRATFWILLAYLVVGTAWFWPWYVTWLVGLAPLVGGRRATAATLTFSASVLVLYIMWGNQQQVPFDRDNLLPVHNMVAFGLPLIVLWWQLRPGRSAAEPVYAGMAPVVPVQAREPVSV